MATFFPGTDEEKRRVAQYIRDGLNLGAHEHRGWYRNWTGSHYQGCGLFIAHVGKAGSITGAVAELEVPISSPRPFAQALGISEELAYVINSMHLRRIRAADIAEMLEASCAPKRTEEAELICV